MNVAKVKTELSKKYPHGNIKENKDPVSGEIIEIVCEIDRKVIGSERNVAVVVADRVLEHYHKKTTEEYEVLTGELTVYLNGRPTKLKKSDRIITPPGTRHRSEGKETWFLCYSVPDWTAADFYLVEK